MESKKPSYKTRLRPKGQLTLPPEVRKLLKVSEGSDVEFYRNELGQLVIQGAQTIAPEQVWFWSNRWQRLERQAQADLEAGRINDFANAAEAVDSLMKKAHAQDPDN